MLNNYPSKVGAKIRTYRKARKVSLAELSLQLNKSKGTISKYENGYISIDVMTLYEIATILQVDIKKLIESTGAIMGREQTADSKLPTKFYMYHAHRQKYYTSIIHLGPTQNNGSNAVTLYYKATHNTNEHIKCANIYHGELLSSDNHLDFTLTNFHNKLDMLHLVFLIPMQITASYPGILLGLQSDNMRPASTRVLLSVHPLCKNHLESNLKFTHKDWRKLKSGSYYTINELVE